MGLLGLIAFLVIIFLGVPISYAMLIVGFWGVAYMVSFSAAFEIVSSQLFSVFSSYSLTVAPMFIFMGFIAFYSGIGASIFYFFYTLTGHIRGGLAIATQAVCAMFGAVCGSLPATVATMGLVIHPEMKKYKYSSALSTGCIASGASIGSLIPPSVLFIIYGLATEQSIGKLFLAGILPGLLLMVLFMITIAIITWYNPALAPPAPKASWADSFKAFRRGGLWEISLVFIVSLGGLFSGWFTPTEAGAVGSISLLIIVSVEKKFSWELLKLSLYNTTKLTAMVFLLIAGATVFGRFFALSRIPAEIGGLVTDLQLPSFVVMGVVILIYFVLGFVIDALALIVITIPIFYPLIVNTLGYDPIWFGVIVLLVVSLGVITPPIGLNVYVIKGVAPEVPLETIFRGVWPFVIALLVCIAILIAYPPIATYLPDLFY